MCLSTYLLITKTKYDLPFASTADLFSGLNPLASESGSSSSSCFAEKNISTELACIV